MSYAYGCPDTKLASRLLMPTILGVLIVGILCLTVGGFFGAIGAFLIFLGSSGHMHAAWSSPGFEITNVGILLLFIAGSIVVVTLERVFKNVQAFVNRLDVKPLKR